MEKKHKIAEGVANDPTQREIMQRHESSTDYTDCIVQLRYSIDSLLCQVAKDYEIIINKKIKDADYKELNKKKELAKEVNAQAAYLGLAICCPKTGLPVFLVADASGERGVGRFQFSAMDGTLGGHRTLSATELPRLTFMPALDRRSRSGGWTAAVCEDLAKNRLKSHDRHKSRR